MNTDNMHHVYRFPLPAAPDQPLSEFNHHLAGLIVFLVGISAFLIYLSPRKFGFLRYVWPIGLLSLGIYLIIYSDAPGWPTSYVSIADTLNDPETMQHKIYALLLISMGLIELARAGGFAKGDSWKFAFPALAAFGAIFLLFHHHSIPKQGMEMMPGMDMDSMHGMHEIGSRHNSHTSHTLIIYQHIGYVICGLGIVVSKVLFDMRKLQGKAAPYIWPSLTMLLGIGLMLYRE